MWAHFLIILHLVAGDMQLPAPLHEGLVRATVDLQARPTIPLSVQAPRVALPSPAPLAEKNAKSKLSVAAARAVVIDADSAAVLFEKRADEEAPIASIAKLMTALVTLDEAESMDQILKVPQAITQLEEDSTLAGFKPGEKVTVGNLLTALLVASANDAAVTLAHGLAGSEKAFAELMNIKAEELGLTHTQFANATGLDAKGSHSSARDVAFLLKEAYKTAAVRSAAEKTSASITTTNGAVYYLQATNKLIGQASFDILATKTGNTDAAGQCLTLLTEADGRRLITVVLGSTDRFTDAEQLIEDTRAAYRWPDALGDSQFAEDQSVDFGG